MDDSRLLSSKLLNELAELPSKLISSNADPLIISSIEYLLFRAKLQNEIANLLETKELLDKITKLLLILPDQDHVIMLKADTLFLLGSVYRDKGILGGLEGAFTFFKKASEFYKSLGEKILQNKCELMMSVCLEMSGILEAAAKRYDKHIEVSDSKHLYLDYLRATLWLGTTLTKLNHLQKADKLIREACNKAFDFDSHIDRGIALQKLGLVLTKQGKFDEAFRSFEEAFDLLEDTPLQRIRFLIGFADLELSSGNIESGISSLRDALSIALDKQFGHQLMSIRSISKKHLGKDKAHDLLHNDFNRKFIPLKPSNNIKQKNETK